MICITENNEMCHKFTTFCDDGHYLMRRHIIQTIKSKLNQLRVAGPNLESRHSSSSLCHFLGQNWA